MSSTLSSGYVVADQPTTPEAPPAGQPSARPPRLDPIEPVDSSLPRMVRDGSAIAPEAPRTLAETGLDDWILSDLALKLTSMVPHVTTDWAAERLRLPAAVVEQIFWQLKEERYVEILGQVDDLNYRYAVTARGRDQVRRSFEVSGYVGPAPVSLQAYVGMLERQTAHRPHPSYEQVREMIANSLVLPEPAVEVAALAASSGRSLFVFGPPGNGKTSLGRLLHRVFEGEIWVPYCISIDGAIIRIFDQQLHQPVEPVAGEGGSVFSRSDAIDRRWVRIRLPFVVVGGEMTMAELDLAYSPGHRFYEAPPHVKANGGTFLIDDFGRQRIEPHELLNRWIIPLEQRVDHLTLHTGQRIEVPFRLMLIVATNLPVNEVSDPAFLRRMGYRLHLDQPTEQQYAEIFRRYASASGMEASNELIESILQRYRAERRELRASEPRDLIERARDLCRLRGQAPTLNHDVINTTWAAYFGLT